MTKTTKYIVTLTDIQDAEKIDLTSEELEKAQKSYVRTDYIPYCHLFNPKSPNQYLMDLALAIPTGEEVTSISVPGNPIIDTTNTCCGEPEDLLYYYDIAIDDAQDPTKPAEMLFYRFSPVFVGIPESCNVKVEVRVSKGGTKKGTTVIRTIDADSYGG